MGGTRTEFDETGASPVIPSAVSLGDNQFFAFIPGLWQGKKPPFRSAAVLRSTNFSGDGLFEYGNVALLDVEAQQLAARQLQRGDIVIERSGGGPRQPVGRVAVFDPTDDRPYATSNFTTAVRVLDRGAFDPRYVCFMLHAIYLSGATENLQRATTGIRNLDWKEYKAFTIPRLSIDDQIAISNLLDASRQSALIERAYLEALASLKRTTMRALFTRGLRGQEKKETEIGPMPENWPLVTLQSVFETQLGKMLSQKAHVGDSPRPYLRNKNVQWGHLDLSDVLHMDFDEREAAKFRLRPGDLLLCEGGVIGRAAIWRGELDQCYYQKALHRIRPRTNAITNAFLFHWLSFAFEHQNLYKVGGASSTIAHLPQAVLEKLVIPCPGEEEQRDLVGILDAIDQKIDIHRRKRAALEDLFKTLLHNLMTGKIRVADLDLKVLT